VRRGHLRRRVRSLRHSAQEPALTAPEKPAEVAEEPRVRSG
jgi:hypothetical protein